MSQNRIQVGTLAVATRDTGVCKAGERGVCYETYTLEGRPGYSFIFEKGGYDGFSPDDVAMIFEVSDVVYPDIASYEFSNVIRLAEDFEAGRFAEALAPCVARRQLS